MQYPCLSLLELKGLIGKDTIEEVFTGVAIIRETDKDKMKKAIHNSSCLKETGIIIKVKNIEDWREDINLPTNCEELRIITRRIGGYGEAIRKQDIIGYLKERYKNKKILESKKPQLTNNSCELTIIITEGIIIYGIPLYHQGKSNLLSINPHNLPYYSPGALNPWFSRLLTNIAGNNGKILLDPFCGTASIPIWSINSYHTILCGDINPTHCKGGLTNYCHLRGFDGTINVIRWDYKYLPIRKESIDVLVTDLPYGRSVRSKGTSEKELSEIFFETFYMYLKQNGVATISTSEDLHMYYKKSLEFLDAKCQMFVHNKLNRVILRFVKR